MKGPQTTSSQQSSKHYNNHFGLCSWCSVRAGPFLVLQILSPFPPFFIITICFPSLPLGLPVDLPPPLLPFLFPFLFPFPFCPPSPSPASAAATHIAALMTRPVSSSLP